MQEVHFFEYVDCFNEAVAPFTRWANWAMTEVTIGISHRNVIIRKKVIVTGRGPHIFYTQKKLHRIWCERKLSFSKSIIGRATTQWQGNVVERIVGWTSKNWANDSDTTTRVLYLGLLPSKTRVSQGHPDWWFSTWWRKSLEQVPLFQVKRKMKKNHRKGRNFPTISLEIKFRCDSVIEFLYIFVMMYSRRRLRGLFFWVLVV